MHKATYLEGTLHLSISPDGPMLIKAGESGGADPTLPDMEFVRSRHQGEPQVYLPGPSLKGVVRAHCERICRTLDGPGRYDQVLPHARELGDTFVPPLADNPLIKKEQYQAYKRGGDDLAYSSGIYFNSEAFKAEFDPKGDDEAARQKRRERSAAIYRRSAFTAQLFGSTALAGRVRFADAYPTGAMVIEERNGVAIDRVYGSVAVGPFNYETVVAGTFATSIAFRNLTLAQLGLLGLALRDLAAGRVAIGFGKSRGLGRVTLDMTSLTLRYPACTLVGNTLKLIGRDLALGDRQLAGLGALCTDKNYGLPEHDSADLPADLHYAEDEERGMGVVLEAKGATQVRALFAKCMDAWKTQVGL